MSKEEIAKFLLNKGYYLTALEFYQELLEDDGTDLDVLKTYFNSQITGKTDPQAIIKSQQQQKVSADSNQAVNVKQKEERISSLENELRQAKEEINRLRSNQIMNTAGGDDTESSSSITSIASNEDKETMKQLSKERIKSHELKILNFLIKNYLIKNNYSLTAVSLADETEQDYKQWSDLKIQGFEPPSILTIYRYFFENGDSGIQGALSKTMAEITKLKKDLLDTETNWREAKKKLQTLQKEKDEFAEKNKDMEKKFEEISRRFKSGSDLTASTNNLLSPTFTSSTSTSSTTATTTTTITNNSATAGVSSKFKEYESLPIMRQTFRGLIEKRRQSVAFRIVADNMDDESECSMRIVDEVDRIRTLESDNQSIVKIVADSLPYIAKGVLINKREELIPLILIVIYNHPDENVRFSLTKFLFNLNKKPNEVQRHVIMRSCMQLASIIGPLRTETEILSQCWEQLSEKHPEKRVLVADSCGCLAQFVNAELRLSLILSILQQLGEDKSKLVREAVAKNFSLLINFFDTPDKYNQIEDSFKKLLYDSEIEVQLAARSFFLPSLANWSDLLESLNSRLTNFLLSELYSTLSKYMNQKDEVKIQESDVIKTDLLLQCFMDIIPRIYQSVIASSPFVTEKDAKQIETECNRQEALYQFQLNQSNQSSNSADNVLAQLNHKDKDKDGSNNNNSNNNSNTSGTTIVTNSSVRISILADGEIAKLKNQFESFINSMVSNDIPENWNSLDWIAKEFFTKFIKICSCIPLYNNMVVIGISKALSKFCQTFGTLFTKKIVKNAFLREFQKDPRSEETKKHRLLSIFTAGVLTSLPSSELVSFLKDIIVLVSMEEKGWVAGNISAIVRCLELLCNNVFDKKKEVCEAISELTSNSSNQVRTRILELYRVVIPLFKQEQIANQVVPSLISMSTDPDRSVRRVCLATSAVAITYADSVSIDRLGISIEKILEDKNHDLEMDFIRSMNKIIPTVNPKFRESFILPRITELARKNNHNPSQENRVQMSQGLFDSARSYLSTLTNPNSSFNHQSAIQILKLLLNDVDIHDSSFKSMVTTMINDLDPSSKKGIISGGGSSSPQHQQQLGNNSSGKLLNKIESSNLSNLNFKNWGWKQPSNNK